MGNGQGVPAAPDPRVPSLAVAVNALRFYSATSHDDFPDPGADATNPDHIQFIISQVYSRLVSGLDQAWDSEEGQGNLIDPNAPDEQWARLVSEMMTCAPYMGPGPSYGLADDKIFFRKMISSEDPAYPIVAACQQLCTISGIVRGFEALAEHPYDAANAVNVCVKAVGGNITSHTHEIIHQGAEDNPYETREERKKRFRNPGRDVPKAYQTIMKPHKAPETSGVSLHLTPGACYVKTGSRHIAFIIRTHEDKRRIQFFDTGAMMNIIGPANQQPENPKPKILTSSALFNTGNYSWAWVDQVSQSCKHWSFLPDPLEPSTPYDDPSQVKPDLAAQLEKMRGARPVGMARFALIDKESGKCVFATPIVLMHESHGDNYSIARFLWSLRYMPGRDKLTGIVCIYIPLWGLAKEMLGYTGENSYEAVRNTSLKTFMESVEKPSYQCISVLSTSPDLVLNHNGWVRRNTHDEGMVVVKHRLKYDASTVTTYWETNPKGGTSSTGDKEINRIIKLPWNQPSCSKDFNTNEFDWAGIEYFQGDFDGDPDNWYPLD